MQSYIIYAKSKVTGSDIDYDTVFLVEAENIEKAIRHGQALCREKNAKYLNCKMITNPYE